MYDLKTIIPATRDYYETQNFVFVHGCIPCLREHDGAYSFIENWRDAGERLWREVRWINGMKAAQTCPVPGKTVVCGHYHTSYGHSRLEGKGSEFGPDADFSPYFGEDNHPMKDMSDVVMIDALYRAGHEKHGPKAIILFTGDGHFQPVARYLSQDCGKKVVLYGVQSATSRMLKDVVTEYHEMPDTEGQMRMCYALITEEMARLTRRYGEVIASFGSLSQRISENNNIPRKTVEMALHEMRDRGLISTQRRKHTDKRSSFDNIVPEWDKLIEAGLYPVEGSV